MKKIKFLMIAMMAIIGSVAFTSCGDDDDDNNGGQSNYDRYQNVVNETVKKHKKSDKVILLVAFGATWQQAFDTFDSVKSEYEKTFPNYDVYLSFSSAICINNARAGEHKAEGAEVREYFDPEHWLTAIGLAGYKQIVVQSLQVTPGEEYRRVRDSYVKDFMNNHNGDFTEAYMKSIDKQVVVGTPLMAEDADVTTLAKNLLQEKDIKAALQEGVVAFMGHGNPEGYDYDGANRRYTELENAFNGLLSQKLFVGTVDMPGNLLPDMYERMLKTGLKKGTKVQLYPLMFIAGDHAHNDMADPDDEESWYCYLNAKGFKTTAYETNYPKAEACWKGYKEGSEYIPALGERSAVRRMWIEHTKEAIKKLGTDEALSTPTTAAE
ncbi:MAG: sirohydrochlorin cobaltochelatase [Prevotella sp.]|uniref:sirohydrochlorin cobaltochelatase n=1 Tax=Prevotella sp. TaxID=59823 RepID=UPI002A29ECC1|nr:sirohydrochlorin cobaltochelatase [Prevotella sp.]MDD7318969.1 sirohydrochlorin cobaltochelatase [Prevotellaceae bacterium]MDY4019995.1 sirohydrochlorin cobaltochelatase [Prevotella sp.]